MNTPLAAASGIMLDGIVSALADKSHLTPAQQRARAGDARALIGTFQPQDTLQVMLVGQALMFNEMLADGARDVLRGMVDTMKLRAQSNLNGLNRSLHQNLGLFLRLRDKAAAVAEQETVKTVTPPAAPEEPSWLDEPYTTWVVETPAEASAREEAEPPPRETPPDTVVRRRPPAPTLVTPEMMPRSVVPELVGTS